MRTFVNLFNGLYRDSSVSDPLLEPLAPKGPSGRAFAGRRQVRLGDVDPTGRLRYDALTRYTQDVSDDDTTDAGLSAEPGWVVRSTVVDEVVPAQLGESLHFETFCSGLGGRWAERRLTIVGDVGARYEVATLWVCIDVASGSPHPLTEEFRHLYGEAAGGRRVSARSLNPGPPVQQERPEPVLWHLRRADLDVYAHVNNAAYWAAVEEWLEPWSGPRRARLEYRGGLDEVAAVGILLDRSEGSLSLWWLDPGGAESIDSTGDPVASASVVEWPDGDPYR